MTDLSHHFRYLLLTIFALTAAAMGQSASGVEYRSYLAHIAAASSAIRLNETGDAKRWLEAAPAKYRGWEWSYLDAKANQYVESRTPHDSSINALAVSPDGMWIASVASDRSVKVTSRADGKESFSFIDEKLVPQSVAFSSDGKRLLAAFSRHTVIMWDLGSKAEIRRFQGQGKGITAAAFSLDGSLVASCSWDRTEERGVFGIVEIWNTMTGETAKKLEYGTKPLTAIAFSPNGKHLAVASWEVDKMAAVWEIEGWKGPETFETEGDEVYKAGQSVAFSPDGRFVAAGGKDSAVRIWNIETRKLVHKLIGHSKWVNGIAFSTDGKTLASASTDQSLKLWNVSTGAEIDTLLGHTKSVSSVTFSRNGLVSGSGDATIKLWSHGGSNNVWKLDGSAYGIDFSPDGRKMATASWLGKIRIWDVASGDVSKEWTGHGTSANAVAYSPDGSRLASVGNDGNIKIWDATNFKELRTLENVKGVQLVSVAFTLDGKHVFSAANYERARLWNVDTGEAVRDFPHAGGVHYIAVSPDGRLAVTGGSDGSVKVWLLADGTLVGTFSGVRSRITCLTFSKDSKWVAAAIGRSGVIADTATFKRVTTLTGHDEGLNGIAFSPDGKRVITASSDLTYKLWDTATGANVLTIPAAATPWNAMFHPDGKSIFLLPLDSTIKVLTSARRSDRHSRRKATTGESSASNGRTF
ncbi:MAG TPA: WD40 repeat domain-containing protein, partial [Pyrinomonadaceae bacterium]